MMTYSQKICSCIALCFGLIAGSPGTLANGPVGEHVNHLSDNIEHYTKEVNWLIAKVDGIVSTYEKKGAKAAKADAVVDHWEAVDFHAAIETSYVPVYASIWQGLYGVKEAVEGEAPLSEVQKQQAFLEESLWQALGAVRLAAQYQQRGLLEKIATSGQTSPVATLEEVKQQLDRVVAKYAEKLPKEATEIIHDTYLTRFEGVEGALIELDANLVEDLEKDFNVTLPKAIQGGADLDKARSIVNSMQGKINTAIALLKKAEDGKKSVF